MHFILTGPPRRQGAGAIPAAGPRFWQVDPIWHVGARGPLPYAIFLLKKRKYKGGQIHELTTVFEIEFNRA